VTDEVKMWIKQHLLQTHSEEVQELKQNLLAYQDMIIQLRTEKKAQFAIIDEYKADHERAAANRTRIEEQEKLIVEQRCEIERLKTADIQIAGVPQEVYKKLKKIDKVMEEKMRDEIRKNEEKFKKDAQELFDQFESENSHLRQENNCMKQRILELEYNSVEKL
jgi:hypothetical protein